MLVTTPVCHRATRPNSVKMQIQNLSANIGVHIKPVFLSHKIDQGLAPKEKNPPTFKNQCLM